MRGYVCLLNPEPPKSHSLEHVPTVISTGTEVGVSTVPVMAWWENAST